MTIFFLSARNKLSNGATIRVNCKTLSPKAELTLVASAGDVKEHGGAAEAGGKEEAGDAEESGQRWQRAEDADEVRALSAQALLLRPLHAGVHEGVALGEAQEGAHRRAAVRVQHLPANVRPAGQAEATSRLALAMAEEEERRPGGVVGVAGEEQTR